MKIEISQNIKDIYEKSGVDIDYAIYELVGYLDKKKTKNINIISIEITKKCSVEISDNTYSKLEKHFGVEANKAAEILLWNNYVMGMDL